MKPTAVLDIGSSKIVCLCGSSAVRGGTVVHGAGIAEYSGFSETEFLNEADLEEAIFTAIRDAEEMARIRIRDIVVSVPAPFSKLIVTDASFRTESRKDRITEEDIDDLISLSLAKAEAPGYVLMHSTPIWFTVDGYTTPEVPQGQHAGEVSASVSHMYVAEAFLDKLTSILQKLSVEISMCISAQLAESLLLIPEEERVRPAVLIDVGYTHTDISVIENAALTDITCIDIGGAQIARDLSYGLDIPLESAEQIKRKYNFLQVAESGIVQVHLLTGIKRVERRVIDLIVQARAEEFVDLIGRSLRMLGIHPESRPVVYLSGGGFSMMRGGCEYLRQKLRLNIKRDMPYMPDMDTPNYTSAFGALDFVLHAGGSDQDTGAGLDTRPGFLNKLRDLFIQ
ncbi:MAG: hypothetical protein II000_05535 [Clostridia bacterium]|nr:hypothetical protein [Clostridia bacterium]